MLLLLPGQASKVGRADKGWAVKTRTQVADSPPAPRPPGSPAPYLACLRKACSSSRLLASC